MSAFPRTPLTVRLNLVTRNFAPLAGLMFVLSVQGPQAQGARAHIFFVDIGTGAGTLIVSPTGKTLLVDGGPPGAGTTKIIPTLDALGIATIDDTVPDLNAAPELYEGRLVSVTGVSWQAP